MRSPFSHRLKYALTGDGFQGFVQHLQGPGFDMSVDQVFHQIGLAFNGHCDLRTFYFQIAGMNYVIRKIRLKT
jgi:hypothetical protein